MKVIIVGAGIAGLAAAIALRRARHDVVVLEKSSMASEIGAAILLQPNAMRVVKRWGLEPERARLVKAMHQFVKVARDASQIDYIDLEKTEDIYGDGFYFAHRVDLLNELKLLATRKEGMGKAVEIMTKKNVCDYVCHFTNFII